MITHARCVRKKEAGVHVLGPIKAQPVRARRASSSRRGGDRVQSAPAQTNSPRRPERFSQSQHACVAVVEPTQRRSRKQTLCHVSLDLDQPPCVSSSHRLLRSTIALPRSAVARRHVGPSAKRRDPGLQDLGAHRQHVQLVATSTVDSHGPPALSDDMTCETSSSRSWTRSHLGRRRVQALAPRRTCAGRPAAGTVGRSLASSWARGCAAAAAGA